MSYLYRHIYVPKTAETIVVTVNWVDIRQVFLDLRSSIIWKLWRSYTVDEKIPLVDYTIKESIIALYF